MHHSVALAEPTAEERAAAEALFREAKGLAIDGKTPEACIKFAESQRLDPKTGTLVYLATCHEDEGKTATAWVEFSEASRQAGRAGQKEREAHARQRAEELEKTLSKVVIRPVDGAGLTLEIDGREVRTFGSPIPFDPGTLVVEASAPGKRSWSTTIEVPKGPSVVTVDVPRLEDLPVAPVKPVPAPSPAPSAPLRKDLLIAGITTGSVGVAGIILGTVTGLRAASLGGDADAVCPTRYCADQAGVDAHETARAWADGSTAAFVVGLAALGTGVVLVVTSTTTSADSTPAAKAETRVTAGFRGGPWLGVESTF
ncbi:MAG: hypothetical protein HOW73_36860 [Polyangiaceae bacterium]|nr:hypothetical protein [Polyangiaceae bacterium]